MWSRGLLDHICCFFINVLRGVLWGGPPPPKKSALLLLFCSFSFPFLCATKKDRRGDCGMRKRTSRTRFTAGLPSFIFVKFDGKRPEL